MGFLSSSCSFTRFCLKDPIPDGFWESVPDRLKKFAFHDIDDLPEERSFGWVSFEDMLDTQWTEAGPVKGQYLVFSLRLDTRRIPAGVFKKHFTLALREEKARIAEQNKKFISRDRKQEIKEQVTLLLRQRFLPIPAECNVIWSMTTQEIWLASTQAGMIDLFIDYFHQTFDLSVEQLTPLVLAERFLDEAALSRLDTLEPTQFAIQEV